MENKFENSRKAAEITLRKTSTFEDLNAETEKEGNEKFSQKTRKLWKDFAVSGIIGFNKETGERFLRPYTDLDGNTSLALLKKAGIDISQLKYIKPGETESGRINLDTGNILGVSYDEKTDTAVFDHHVPSDETVTSTAEILYNVLADLELLEKSKELDRLVDFVTKMDNRQFPPEEFLKSGKTIIGIQRHLNFDNLLEYFRDHESANDILTPDEFEKYGSKDAAENQQKIVDAAMQKLASMKEEGKIVDTSYGKVVINVDNELHVGSSAAYVKYDGIINFTPRKSFAVTFKEKNIDEKQLKEKLGEKFQGKIIRGKMWIFNEDKPLKLSLEEINNSLK